MSGRVRLSDRSVILVWMIASVLAVAFSTGLSEKRNGISHAEVEFVTKQAADMPPAVADFLRGEVARLRAENTMLRRIIADPTRTNEVK